MGPPTLISRRPLQKAAQDRSGSDKIVASEDEERHSPQQPPSTRSSLGLDLESSVHTLSLFEDHRRQQEGTAIYSKMPIQSSVYSFTPLKENEIRVLVLSPSEDAQAPLQGRLEIQDLEPRDDGAIREASSKAYEAISYTCKEPAYVSSPFISLSGSKIELPPNLICALKQFRLHNEERRLWVDAACIYMQNIGERCHQIPNMPRIFRQASGVLVWLGSGKLNDGDVALQFLQDVVEATDTDEYLRGNNSSTRWGAVAALLLRPYFTRIWIVQEIALARRASMCIGAKSLDWKIFEAAIAIFDQRNQIYRNHPPSEVEIEGASRLIGVVRGCFTRDSSGEIKKPLLSLEELVYQTSQCQATDARDKIFALLAIACDIHLEKPEILPDYTKSVKQVYTEFFQFCIQQSGSLDVIFRPWNRKGPFPIWLDPTSEFASSLVQPPGQKQHYSAHWFLGHGNHANQLKWSVSLSTGMLQVKGSTLSKIDLLSEPNLTEGVPQSWFHSVAMIELFEMLLAHYSGSQDHVRLVLKELVPVAQRNNVDVLEMMGQDRSLGRVRNWISDLVKGRRLMRTIKGNLLGLAPAGTKQGDILAMFPSCSVPVVLRGFGTKWWSFHTSPTYRLVGTCYVDELMDSETAGPTVMPITPLPYTFNIVPSRSGHGIGATTDDSYIPSTLSARSLPPSVSPRSSLETMIPTPEDSERPAISTQAEPSELLDVNLKGFRLHWTCKCGHKGFDYYIEYRRGSVRELAQQLELRGFLISMVPWNAFHPDRDLLKSIPLRFRVIFDNLWRRVLANAGSHPVTQQELPAELPGEVLDRQPNLESPTPSRSSLYLGSAKVSNHRTPLASSLAGNTAGGESALTANAAQSKATSSGKTGTSGGLRASVTTPGQSGRSSQPTPTPPGQPTATGATRMNVTDDYILLCFRIKKYLMQRHDLGVIQIQRDRQLFEAFRDRYNARFSWMYRQFSLYTVQKMHFIKFTLRPRQEVDGIEVGMPPVTEYHYDFDPRPPGRIPAIGSDFLMHRFHNPEECLQDVLCLNQIPKRTNERPTPGLAPDLHTGWGMHLEEGLDAERIFCLLLLGFVSSTLFGVLWAVLKKSIQDGFSVAAFIATSEALAVAMVQLFLTMGSGG